MGLCVSGVSGGLAVGPPTTAPQFAGVSLSQAGDYATIFVSNAAAPGGPDTAGQFALSGTFDNAVVSVQFVGDVANFQSANWQELNSATRSDTHAQLNGPLALEDSTALQLNPGQVQGLYAVRVYLNSITSGAVLVGGSTFPGDPVSLNAAILAQSQANGLLLEAIALGLSDMNSTDYLAAVGGQF